MLDRLLISDCEVAKLCIWDDDGKSTQRQGKGHAFP
jgi:hypothetical protein